MLHVTSSREETEISSSKNKFFNLTRKLNRYAGLGDSRQTCFGKPAVSRKGISYNKELVAHYAGLNAAVQQ